MNKHKMIGLIGGMGPYASAHFYRLLLDKSSQDYGAKNNDDYPEIVIDSVPVPYFISDTTRLAEAKNMLMDRAQRLNNFGCGVIGMVCNTGHILYKDLAKQSETEFVSMIDLVAREAQRRNLKRVGILSTQTTIKTGLYKKALKNLDIGSINEDENMQLIHETIIKQVVAGKVSDSQRDLLEDMTRRFIDKEELDGVILGCTELPLVFPKDKFENVIDSMDALANELLFRYYQGGNNEKS